MVVNGLLEDPEVDSIDDLVQSIVKTCKAYSFTRSEFNTSHHGQAGS